MILIDLTHTSHTGARTGVQKVCRSLQAELTDQHQGEAICFDPYRRAWRTLNDSEHRRLKQESPAAKRGARWTWSAKVKGSLQRLVRAEAPILPASSGLLFPEIFSPLVGQSLAGLWRRTRGPRVAVFHDAIALKYPEMTPGGTVSRFPLYLTELAQFDGIAAVSEDSRDSLRGYWEWLGLKATPPVQAIPLGIDTINADRAAAPPARAETQTPAAPVILSVGTIEARKNHLSLLEAAEILWAEGQQFELHLIGMANAQTGGPALARINQLKTAGRPLRYDGPVTDAALRAAYAGAHFTVYPSLIEGFGLPVLESLQAGKPCICSGRGALGESARGGGCIPLDHVDPQSLAEAMRSLLIGAGRHAALAFEARNRPFRTWSQYARELQDWMGTLTRRT